MRLIRANDCRVMPWKNGGGETAEIAAFPSGSGVEDFDWRVSRARVASDGPFSRFRGVDRTLAVLEGKGMELVVDDEAPFVVTLDSDPITFAADRSTTARLLAGPVADMNIMTRRGVFDHRVTRVAVSSPCEWAVSNHPMLVFCAKGSASILSESGFYELERYDTLITEVPTESLKIEGAAPTLVYRIDVRKL